MSVWGRSSVEDRPLLVPESTHPMPAPAEVVRPPQESLVTTRWVRPMLVSSAVGLAAVIGLGVAVDRARSPLWFDRVVNAHLLIRYEGFGLKLDSFLNHSAMILVAIGAVLAIASLRLGSRRAAALYVLAPGFAVAVSEVIKHLVVRQAGPPPLQGYPSGHEAGAVALCAATVLILGRPGLLAVRVGPVGRMLSWLLAVAIPVGLGVALSGLHWHQPTDVIGGLWLGLAAVAGVAPLIDRYAGAAEGLRSEDHHHGS
jgi:PAP2 superfamily